MTEHYIVYNPDGPDYEFSGELIAKLDNYKPVGNVEVWETSTGKFVLRQRKMSRPGQFSIDRTLVLNTKQEVADCLGFSEEAKEVWTQLGIKTACEL